jgi:hypothetical protein
LFLVKNKVKKKEKNLQLLIEKVGREREREQRKKGLLIFY